jgi:hypothetical protein
MRLAEPVLVHKYPQFIPPAPFIAAGQSPRAGQPARRLETADTTEDRRSRGHPYSPNKQSLAQGPRAAISKPNAPKTRSIQ